jgi:hypothetical protein
MKQKAGRSQTFMMPAEGSALFERKEFKDFASGTSIIKQTQQEFVVQKLQELLLPENKQELDKLIKGSYENYGNIFKLLNEYEKLTYGGKIKHDLILKSLEESGDYKRLKEIADSVGAYLMVDMAHFSGFVATQLLNNPFDLLSIQPRENQTFEIPFFINLSQLSQSGGATSCINNSETLIKYLGIL